LKPKSEDYESVIEWLLEKRTPSVRYWALQDLLGLSPNSSEVTDTHEGIKNSTITKTILEAQQPEGFWVHEDDMYLPKYKATTHQLLILAELGVPRTEKVEKGIEQIFRFQRNSGHFLTKLPKSERGRDSVVKDGCCLDGNILFYLIQFGYYEDPRTMNLMDFIIDYHDSENSGWACRAYPINSEAVFPENCYMGSTKILKALSFLPKNERTGLINQIVEAETEKILANYIFKYLRNPDGSRKDKSGWKRFGFPLFYQSDVIEVLDTLTRLGVKDERMAPAITLVEEAKGKDGKWLLKNSFNGKMWIDIEEKNKPSKWITLRAMRILERYYNGS
jgi:hypothetical protein